MILLRVSVASSVIFNVCFLALFEKYCQFQKKIKPKQISVLFENYYLIQEKVKPNQISFHFEF